MKKYIFFILFCFPCNFIIASRPIINSSEKIASGPVEKIVKSMAKSNLYEASATIGHSGTSSKQNARFEKLLKIASIEKLSELATKHKNAVVRLYAFKGLVSKLNEVPEEIVNQFKNDTTLVAVMQGAMIQQIPLNKLAMGFLD